MFDCKDKWLFMFWVDFKISSLKSLVKCYYICSSDAALLYIFSGKSLQQSARLLSTLICQELVVISAASTMYARYSQCLLTLHAGYLSCFFVVYWFFSKLTFLKNSFRNIIRVSKSLNPAQARHFVGPDLGPNCLQKLSADDTRK